MSFANASCIWHWHFHWLRDHCAFCQCCMHTSNEIAALLKICQLVQFWKSKPFFACLQICLASNRYFMRQYATHDSLGNQCHQECMHSRFLHHSLSLIGYPLLLASSSSFDTALHWRRIHSELSVMHLRTLRF